MVRAVAIWALALVAADRAGAMQARPLALEEIITASAQAVYGTVTAVAGGRDAHGIPATWVTFEVYEGLKGAATGTLTFKHVGVASPLPDGTLLRLPGLPRFRVGRRYVVFLHAASAQGFTSPVGLAQGVYREETAAAGAVVIGEARARPAARPLASFLDEVRRQVGR